MLCSSWVISKEIRRSRWFAWFTSRLADCSAPQAQQGFRLSSCYLMSSVITHDFFSLFGHFSHTHPHSLLSLNTLTPFNSLHSLSKTSLIFPFPLFYPSFPCCASPFLKSLPSRPTSKHTRTKIFS